ncbi:hypothetical protein NIES970_30030 (plasmid) [[Synechococcus] sp. NIES-970]|nr:hypothetical protein NIES970_30030 [[Synechococcus] sp. NIES-970]
MKKKILFRSLPLAFLATLFGGIARAELYYVGSTTLERYVTNPDNGSRVYLSYKKTYVDRESIGGILAGTIQWDSIEMTYGSNGIPVFYSTTQIRGDCRNQKIRLQRRDYSIFFGQEKKAPRREFFDGRYTNVSPGSIGHQELNFVCSRYL